MSPDSYKPFDHTREVTKLAIEWLRRDRMKLAFEILDKALRKEFDDHVSDGHSVTYYPRSALVLGKGRALKSRPTTVRFRSTGTTAGWSR